MNWQQRLAIKATDFRMPDLWFAGLFISLVLVLAVVDWHSANVRTAAIAAFLAGRLTVWVDSRALRDLLDEQSPRVQSAGTSTSHARISAPWRRVAMVVSLGLSVAFAAYALRLRYWS